MCGIAGMVQTHPDGAVDSATIHRMCEAIVHRGPDDEGIFVKAGVGLGMRRLSIIDLAGGHQPVFNEDKTICDRIQWRDLQLSRVAFRTSRARPSFLHTHRH